MGYTPTQTSFVQGPQNRGLSNQGPGVGGNQQQPIQATLQTPYSQPSPMPGNRILGNAFQNTGPGNIGGQPGVTNLQNILSTLGSIYGGGSAKGGSPSPFMGQPFFQQPMSFGYRGGGK